MKILKFSASWCQPCKMLSKTLEDVDLKGCELQELDVEENQELTSKYGIRNIPTMIMVDEAGEPKAVSIGMKSKADIEKWLSANA